MMKLKMNERSEIIKNRSFITRTLLFIILILILSGFYLRFAWKQYEKVASSEAIILAQSLATFMHHEHITKLSGSSADLDNEDYLILKNSLNQLVNTTNPIRFAYLFAERSNELVILMDSELPESPDYSPPGQIYTEADEIYLIPFTEGETVLTYPITDRWGHWISALVPIKSPSDGSIIAVLGIDYDVTEWYSKLWARMVPDFIIVTSIIIITIALIRASARRTKLQDLSTRLAYDEALYRSVFTQAPAGIALVDDKNFVFQTKFGEASINPMFQRIIGRSIDDLAKTQWTDITHPDDLSADLEKYELFKNGEIEAYSMEKRFIKPDGSTVWTNMNVTHLLGVPLKHSMHLCMLEDISVRKSTEDALKESERSKSVLLSHLPGMAYRCNNDREWTMLYVSEGCYELTGYLPASLIHNRDLSFNSVISSEYREVLWKEWEQKLAKRAPFRQEYEIITAGGDSKWVLELAEGIYNQNDELEALEGIIIDISDRKALENTLVYSNEHDRWTGLYNRFNLEHQLQKDTQIDSAQKRALIGINLGATQSMTAAYGFHYTQDLLKKAADTLNRFCNEQRMLYNTYWDRFVFYIKDYQDTDELVIFSDQIASTLEVLFKTERINGGIGIIEIDQTNMQDVDVLLKKLLIASEKSMASSEKDFISSFYDENMEADILREEEVKRELAQIADDENSDSLFVQFQPIFDLRCNQICGFEALARINSEKLGRIPPLEFIPLAEKTKLIIPIGQKIMRMSLTFLRTLNELGFVNIEISINISAIQLLRNNFVEDLISTIEEMRVSPDNITLELTESVLAINYDEINSIIKRLRSFGIGIAIDDFGTGYSSLARERELDVDCLKIDKYFIDKLMYINPEKAITRDIISMAHKLGHCAVAEGVEHEKQKQYLLENGCDKIQGYLVSRPLDESVAIELLQSQVDINISCCSCDKSQNGERFAIDMLPEMSKEELRLILDSAAEAIFGIDLNGICTFCNISCIKMLGYNNQDELLDKNMHLLCHHSYRNISPMPIEVCKIYMSMREGKGFTADDEVYWKSDGTMIEVEYRSYPQIRNDEVVGAVVTFMDVSERKRKEEEIQYLNYHDVLTGLKNRRFFEENLDKFDRSKNWPLSVIFADINGLKMTNDIFGHSAGDELIQKAAEILKNSCREHDLIARVGGDEFIILLPKTSQDKAYKVLSRIRNGFADAHVAAIKCSISIGADTKTDSDQTIEVTMANAENAMYKDKTMNRKAINKEIINTIVDTLHSRCAKERDHSLAVQNLCYKFGEALEMPESEIEKLQRSGYLHDIGKITLENNILINDNLNEEGTEKMRQHPIDGYRILSLFDETLDIAEYVYNHHEHWDGTGYPRGLKGVQIPLISRIISVLETYERIVNRGDEPIIERARHAIKEIKNGSGTQFDPMIADRFASLMGHI